MKRLLHDSTLKRHGKRFGGLLYHIKRLSSGEDQQSHGANKANNTKGPGSGSPKKTRILPDLTLLQFNYCLYPYDTIIL